MTYALITGGSSGIGTAIAHKLAEANYDVILVARNEGKLQTAQAEIKGEYPDTDVRYMIQDVGDIDFLPEFYKKTKEFDIHIWVNSAGYSIPGGLLDYDMDDYINMTNINGLGPILLSKFYVEDYKDTEGTALINVSSTSGYSLVGTLPYYSDVKFLISAFTESLANELQNNEAKLKAKVLAPGPADTPFVQISRGAGVEADDIWARYNTASEIADYFMSLLNSEATVGKVNTQSFEFELLPPQFPNRW